MNENMDENKIQQEDYDAQENACETEETEENVIIVDAIIEEEAEEEEEAPSFNLFREIREWVSAIVIAVAITFIIKLFVFDVVMVDGHSMDTTLAHGQRIIITKLGYKPEAGDIIVLDSNYKKREAYIEQQKQTNDDFGDFDALMTRLFPPKDMGLERKYYIKRIIATENQTVTIYPNGEVWVDDKLLDEPYIGDNITYPIDAEISYPYTVEEGCVFVMGDNRQHSSDSRDSDLGSVPHEAILGKSGLRIWPISDFGTIEK